MIELARDHLSGDHAIHGQGWRRPWQVVSADATRAVLEQRHAPDGFWPFAYRARQDFTLTPDGVALTMSVENIGDEAMPAGLGHHPFFRRAPDTRLQVGLGSMWEGDVACFPRRRVTVPDAFDFRTARAVDAIDLDAVFVSLGGGGLIGGIGAWLKAHAPATRVIACSPVNSAVMMRSVEAGRILTLDSLPTLSDGTAGGVEPGSITFDLVRAVVDEHVAVGEDEIAAAMRDTMEAHHMMVEGAAGVAVAGFRRQAARWSGARVAIVLCGANVSLSTLKSILP
jgi:hypothetical protein